MCYTHDHLWRTVIKVNDTNPKIKVDWSIYTDKQKNAISGYIRHGNKNKAYREAYDVSKQKPNTTLRNCQKFFKQPKIKVIIDQVQEEAVRRANIQVEEAIQGFCDKMVEDATQEEMLNIDAYWVLRRTALLADFNIRKFIKTDDLGNATYDFSEATDDDWYCIQEYTVEEISRGNGEDVYHVDKLKIKVYDKLKALELVGKHVQVQAFREQVGHGNPDGSPFERIVREIVEPQNTDDQDS